MFRLRIRCPLRLFFCVSVIVSCGCATTFKPVNSIQNLQDEVSQKVVVDLSVTCNGVRVKCYPIIDEELIERCLGILPEELEVLPVFLKVENMSQNPVKIDLPNSLIIIGKKEKAYIDVDGVAERISKEGGDAALGLGIMFGIFGGAIGGAVGAGLGAGIDSSKSGDGTVEEYYDRLSFNPTFIHPENSGAGLVFYYLSKDDFDSASLTLSIPIVNLNSNDTSNAEITFKPADFKIAREDGK